MRHEEMDPILLTKIDEMSAAVLGVEGYKQRAMTLGAVNGDERSTRCVHRVQLCWLTRGLSHPPIVRRALGISSRY